MKRIILISAPWPLFSRPSIQLGTLKAYLKNRFSDLGVEAAHFYLKIAAEIGYDLYQSLSERTWLAETIYGLLLYPDRSEQIEKLFRKEARGKSVFRGLNPEHLAKQVRKVTHEFISRIDWGSFGLAGFSISLCQMTASLYLIREIKRRFPELPIVVGGSLFSGNAGLNLFEAFPEIDVLVNGEGERPLTRLIRHLKVSRDIRALPSVPGIITRYADNFSGSVNRERFLQTEDMTQLPEPDYDDYFQLLSTLGPEKRFFPRLPVEMSRGCWWRSKSKGCAFCNLNLQWEGYRAKTPARIVSEIDHLCSAHKLLSVAVMDNAPPIRTSREIFSRLGSLNKDLKLFCELRASTGKEILKAMKAGGLNEVQIGIEALSTRLLNKMNKGTTAIRNLEIMRDCEALGIVNNSNLILHFPGSDQTDADDTLRNLEFVIPFRPLRFVHFWLGLGSPVWENPKEFGIRAVFNHPNYSALFPKEICRPLTFMIQGYRGDIGYQRKLWRPVREKIKAWKKTYSELHQETREPILSFRDGREFLIIRQRHPGGQPFTHRLTGTSRAIYLYCQKHHSIQQIMEHFSGLTEDNVLPFLRMMTDKKLMFEEHGKYLSLAVRVKT